MECLCGCKQEVKKGNKFIWGHNGRVLSEETRNKRSSSLKKAWENPESRKNRIKKMRELWKDPDYIRNRKEAMNREEVKEKISIAAKRNMKNPDNGNFGRSG